MTSVLLMVVEGTLNAYFVGSAFHLGVVVGSFHFVVVVLVLNFEMNSTVKKSMSLKIYNF